MKVRFKIQLLEKMGMEDAFNSTPNYVDLVNLVRSIQRAEGNIDCYRRGRQKCDRLDCVWRDHCLIQRQVCKTKQGRNHAKNFSAG